MLKHTLSLTDSHKPECLWWLTASECKN